MFSSKIKFTKDFKYCKVRRMILRFSVRVNLTVLTIITKFDKYSSKLGFFTVFCSIISKEINNKLSLAMFYQFKIWDSFQTKIPLRLNLKSNNAKNRNTNQWASFQLKIVCYIIVCNDSKVMKHFLLFLALYYLIKENSYIFQ